MGNSINQAFQSGSALLSSSNPEISDGTAEKVRTIFEALVANPKVPIQKLEGILFQIQKNENILAVQDETGYNLLQKCVGMNHVDLVRWILTHHKLDINRFCCSLPLHIACLKGYEECVELLLKHGARIDTEARMCFPSSHLGNCEESSKNGDRVELISLKGLNKAIHEALKCRRINKLQSAVHYTMDGDQLNVLNILIQKMEEPWMLFRARKPLLHLACERGAWKCLQYLVTARAEEIHVLHDEYFPIHQAVLHNFKLVELLLQHGASPHARTCTQQMNLLHVVFLVARKCAEDTISTMRSLLDRGCKDLINSPDSLGNTPLHALIVRYSLEEARYGYHRWTKWDVMTMMHQLFAAGARHSINRQGNSALACVLRHVRDWDVCYELLNMMLAHGGDPNLAGRDGSAPLMVCLVPLINKNPLHRFTHSLKVYYMNCVRILLQYGANPNCSYRGSLTPMHVLTFSIGENATIDCPDQKRDNFQFLKNLLLLLLQYGLNANERISPHKNHILQNSVDMIQNIRSGEDLNFLSEVTVALIQYGANPNIPLSNKTSDKRSPTATADDAKDLVLYYYISLVIQKENICRDPKQTFASVANIYYCTMDHDLLYACLRALHIQFLTQVPNRNTESVVALVQKLYGAPRSLKQAARLVVLREMDPKPATQVSKLNLPAAIKDYLMFSDL